MDTVTFYRRCIKQLLSEYQTLSNEWSQIKLLFDDHSLNYMVVRVGWFKHKRIHLCLIHMEIVGDTIMVQANNTEHLLDEYLMELGIPKAKIIPGFVPAEALAYAEPAASLLPMAA